MSRKIDQLPEPAQRRRMKLVIASASRSGTMALYSATKILGYRPYHMIEVCLVGGVPHMELLVEAVQAQYNRFSGIRRYDKADFEKWLADYDCLVEIASYMGLEAIKAYAEDPEVKFILTERDPDRWASSINNTVAGVVKMATSFPISVLKHFEGFLGEFLYLNQVLYWAISDGTNPEAPGNREALRRNYVEYLDLVKKTVPAERLLIVRLEDGLGWEEICPFLGQPIPEEPYPDRNEPEKFKSLVTKHITPRVQTAALRLAGVAVPVLGVLGWAALKYGPSLSAAMTRSF